MRYHEKVRKLFLFLIAFYLIFNFLLLIHEPTFAQGGIICSGKVTDQNTNQPLQGVTINAIYGSASKQVVQPTNSQGEYSFRLLGFGIGIAEVKTVEFSLSGYSGLVVDTSGLPGRGAAQCPGNVTLEPVTTPTTQGYVCDLSLGCALVPSNAEYGSLKACQTDCQKLKYHPKYNRCDIPDTQYHKQSEECGKVPVVVTTPLPAIPTPTLPNITPVCLGGICQTAVGPIPTSPAGLVSFLFKLVLGLSGGIALILIIVGAYQMMTSQGNPEKLQGAKETITSAIVGLLFIIFSLLLLEIIGVDILRIPGFGR